jgi:hypothetical protein
MMARRGFLRIPVKDTHPSDLYEAIREEAVNPRSLDQFQVAQVAEHLYGDGMLSKHDLAALFKMDRGQIHKVLTANRVSQTETELADDLDPRLIAKDVLNMRDKAVYLCFLLRHPRQAWMIFRESIQVLQELGEVPKAAERVQFVDESYQIEFSKDGSIEVMNMEQDSDGVFKEKSLVEEPGDVIHVIEEAPQAESTIPTN